MSGSHRQPRSGRRKRDLRRTIAEQKEYIDLCDRTIAQLCDENDDLRKVVGWPTAGAEDDTVIMPKVVPLEPPTHTIPIVLPSGRVLRTETGRKRPSWAEKD